MKILKKITLFLLGLLLVVLIIGVVGIQILKPDYSGKKLLSSLEDEVEVYYDDYGIPHIYGKTDLDAFRALGFVHAQDRLWQMELLRRVGSGRLSEVFGKDLIETDKFFLNLGIDEASKKTVASVDRNKKSIQLAEAYLDGINQFIAEGPTPIEFYLTGIDKTEFSLEDVYNTMGYMAFSFAMAHKTDPLLTNISNKLGPAYLTDLEITSSADLEWIKNYEPSSKDSIQNTITASVTKALEKLDLPMFEGSNSWVIGPEKTKNAKVILANDPHIGFSQPSVWYEAHLETPTYSKYGYHMAGIPFALLGHNRDLAFGITMFENDDIDFYYEENNPENENQYATENGWEDYELITKTIKVKDTVELKYTYKKSIHGPLLSGVPALVKYERPIAMSWIYTQMENKGLDAFYEMGTASNVTEFKKALPKLHAPGLNIMYGDAENNIGWFATAQLYTIADSVQTKMVFDNDTGLPVQKTLLDFSENPQAVNPPWNYVYSANNQPDSIAGMLYPGYYLPENRGKRIVDLLEPKDDWDIASASEMILDVTSSVDPLVVKDFTKLMDVSSLNDIELKALDLLGQWQGDYPLESVAGTIYTRWVYYFLKNIFHDELGDELFQQFLATHLHKRVIAPMAAKPNSVWWDNLTTTDKVETQKDIVVDAFKKAIASLNLDFGSESSKWTWNKVHTLEHPHPIGQVAALRSFFNVGPFPISGTREVINNMYFGYDGEGFYEATSGPSTRRIIDFSDIENSLSILPTGQSGNPFSAYYRDQAELYNQGMFRKMLMNEAEIKNSKEILIFRPKE
jgi:penicillin amidase